MAAPVWGEEWGLVGVVEGERGGGWKWGAYAWTDAGDDGDVFAGHCAYVGGEGGETGGGVHEPLDGKRAIDMAGSCLISNWGFSNR